MIIPAYYEEKVYEDIDLKRPEEAKFELVRYGGYIIECINTPYQYKTDTSEQVMYLVRMLVKKDGKWQVETRNEDTVFMEDKDVITFVKERMNANRI